MMRVEWNTEQISETMRFMANMTKNGIRARNAALSSVGYKLKQTAKEAIRDNKFGWPNIRNLTLITNKNPAMQGKKDQNYSSKIKGTITLAGGAVRRMWGVLANLLVYSVEKTEGVLLFGFKAGIFGKKLAYKTAPLGPDGKPVNGSWGANQASSKNPNGVKVYVDNVIGDGIITLARKLTLGFENKIVSIAQQRYFAAFGFFFSLGRTLICPPRPIVGPTVLSVQDKIPQWFVDKFWERMQKYSQEKS